MTDAAVECYSGQAYAQRPRAFQWEGKRLEVQAIIAEWQTPESKHFRVRTADQQIFELVYIIATDAWKTLHFW